MRLNDLPRHLATGAAALALTLPIALTAQTQQAQGRGTAQQGQQQGQQGQQGQRGAGGGRGQGRAAGPARDASQQQITQGTGGLAGSVTVEGSGAPARRARITLSGPELRPARSAVTDDQGRYTFSTLPAGRFTLTASKPGYLDMTYGAKKPGRPGTPIQLADAQKLDHIDVALPKGGVVTGIVVDENGEASPNTQVRVMKYVIRTGEKTLQQAGTDTTDDRGMYRIFSLTPGEYIVSAVPRNANLGDLRQTLQAEIETLMQQAQAAGANTGGGGGGGGGGRGGRGGVNGAVNQIVGGRGQQFLDQATALQQQLAQSSQEQTVAYAPVFFPGTIAPGSAQAVNISAGEERAGVDFQLQLVPTARVEGTITSPDGALPQGTQVALVPMNENGVPSIPGLNMNMTRVDGNGHFAFLSVTPGQYTAQARSVIRDPNAQGGAAGGRGGAGGPGGRGFGPGGAIQQVLWASTDVTVNGQNITNLALNLQPGMTIGGRVAFEGTTLAPPTDLTRVRVTLQTRGTQPLEIGGGPPPAQVDASGHFTITGVAPGTYVLSGGAQAGNGNLGGAAPAAAGGRGGGGGGGQAAGVSGGLGPAGNWVLKSAMINGRDSLDFPIDVRPNEDLTSAVLTFTDQSQAITGTLQDASGRPTPDYTIVVFAADKNYWTPQSRRISTARPGTDGKYSIRGLPAGDYRLTAVTDVEPGEWYDPAFLQQVVGQSIAISLQPGEQKTQDLKLAGGGH